jgi:hypothetical protein
MNARFSLALLAAALVAAGTVAAAPRRADKKDKEIAKWINRLGLADAQAREYAATRLTALGPATLPALRDAARGKNPQVRKRAEEVIKAIAANGAKLVDKELAKANAAGAVVRPVADGALARTFPSHLFYSVILRQFPLGRVPPKPFKVQNLFLLGPDGKLKHLTDVAGLQKFFQSHLAPVTKDKAVKEVTRAWLALAVELYQDLFFQFSVPKDGVSVAAEGKRKKATGKSVVKPVGGNGGQVEVVLVFNAAGKLDKVTQTAKLKQGIRPICQATKLLDPDPIVRRMAEKDILVMGRAARDYLKEQRAQAKPALKKAIDRLWKRIVDEGW